MHPRFVILIIFIAQLLSPLFAFSSSSISFLRQSHSYEHYYIINTETVRRPRQTHLISLLNWSYYQDPLYQAPPPYNRTQQFKPWIRDPSHQTCFNVRGLVLKRQALSDINTSPKNSCLIVSSKWYDPYSDKYFYNAQDLQIDHVVPLKNAYSSGAWQWSQIKRCHYANFIEDTTHLMAVSRNANESKGDSDPDTYMPINDSFQCQYLSIWLKIKALWKLKIAIQEAEAIETLIKENNCSKELFYMDESDFQSLQSLTEMAPKECLNRKDRSLN